MSPEAGPSRPVAFPNGSEGRGGQCGGRKAENDSGVAILVFEKA